LRQPAVDPVGDPIAGQGDRTGARQGPAGGSLRLVSDGLRLLRDNRLFRRLVLLSVVTIPFRDYLGSLYQPRFVAAGVPPVWLGLSLSLASGLSVLGARYAYWLEERLGADWGLLVATGLPGVLYLAMAAVVHPGFTILVFCMLYGSMSLRGPILSGRLNAHIASENRATVLSLISMLSGLYVALVGLLFGRIADLSVSYALLAMGLVVLTGSLFFRVGRGDRVSPGEGDRFRSQCGGKHGTV
jgi:hypothetical protein